MARKAKHAHQEPSPLGRFVLARREELRLSQEDVAAALGTSHSIISQLERDGRYQLNKRHFPALVRILQTDMDTVLAFDGLRTVSPGRPSPHQQDAINLILRMSDARARLARGVLRALLEEPEPQPAGHPEVPTGPHST
jgi:transcriptional regulator with XRE-family HTH domain